MPLNPDSLRTRLRSAAVKFRCSQGARWLISCTAASLFILFIFLIGDNFFHFGGIGRWVAFIAIFFPLLSGILLAVPAFLKRVSDEGIARRIERSCPGANNVLINAVQFDRELAGDSPMRSALFLEMKDPFPGVRWGDVLDFDLLKKLSISFFFAALALTGWGLLRPAYFANSAARIFHPGSRIEPLTRTQIVEIKPGNTDVPNGGQVNLTVHLGGEIPRVAHVFFREVGSGWQRELLDHNLGTSDFSYVWKDVRQPMEYYLEAGDRESEVFKIRVRPKTVFSCRLAEIIPPGYTGLPKVSAKDFSSLKNILSGSKLMLSVEFNNPVADLRVSGEKDGAFSVVKTDSTHWQMDAVISASEALKLAYKDEQGMEDSDILQVRVKADDPPKIHISAPPEGSQILAKRDSSLLIQFSVSDDYGLGSVALYKSTNEKADSRLVREWKSALGKKAFQDQTSILLSDFCAAEDETVTFCLLAKDRNDVSGPGVTISRPVVVQLKSRDDLVQKSTESQSQLRQGIDELLKLQQTNLEQTRLAITSHADPKQVFPPLLTRQSQIAVLAQTIVDSGDVMAPELRSNLRSLLGKEIKDSITALKNAATESGNSTVISASMAVTLESAILARLKGTTDSIEDKAGKEEIMGLIGGVEELLHRQRDLCRETVGATHQTAKALSDRQDALGEQAEQVRKGIIQSAQNASLGDKDFRARLQKAADQLAQSHVYADMLTSADKIQSELYPEAVVLQKTVMKNLVSILDSLNQWQLAEAGRKIDQMKNESADMKERLETLEAIQKEILEKSKELARKTDFRPEDVATAKEITKSKELMAAAIEQMLKDGHIFPDVKQGNEMQTELTKIFEDVIQADKQEAEQGTIKPNEIAVQKEDSLLKAIETAKKIDEDMEMWLPNEQNKTKWLLENFDKTEMPDMPMLPLPEEFEDLIGDLVEQQKDLADQIEDSAANQLFAQNPGNGQGVSDGNQDSFAAQGKSGNERPKSNEQAGRSSGGREGMSDGEMAGKRADNLEGTKAKMRRARDAMQHGQVEDDGPAGVNLATGGGKSGGYSLQNGMDGNAPVKAVRAPSMAALNAAAAAQAQLAEKTSKQYAQASLLFLKSDGLSDVPRLMEESAIALKDGQVKDFNSLHRQIIGKLQAARSDIQAGAAMIIPGNTPQSIDKQALGGEEGQVPEAYKQQVSDYYRSLAGEK